MKPDDAALRRIRRALVLSSSGSLHLLEVSAPRALAELMRAWEEAPVAQVLTPHDMADGARLTERVLGALLADDRRAAPLLLDASAAYAPDDRAAWTECLHRWNERRDRVLLSRTAPMIFAAPPWLQGLLSECAPDVWSTRGPSARVEAVPPPRIPWVDRSPAPGVRAASLKPSFTIDDAAVREARRTLLGAEGAGAEARRRAAIVLQHVAVDQVGEFDIAHALESYRLAITTLRGLCAETPADEEVLTLLASSLASRGALHARRESHHEAAADFAAVLETVIHEDRFTTSHPMSVAAVVSASVHLAESFFFIRGATAAKRSLAATLHNLSSLDPSSLVLPEIAAGADALAMRVGIFAADLPFATQAAERVSAQGRGDDVLGRASLAEFHLDRGDDLRAAAIVRLLDTGELKPSPRIAVALARIAHEAADADTSRRLLLVARNGETSPGPFESAEAALLAQQLCTALCDSESEAFWTRRARDEVDRIRRADPDAPRTRRLAARLLTAAGPGASPPG